MNFFLSRRNPSVFLGCWDAIGHVTIGTFLGNGLFLNGMKRNANSNCIIIDGPSDNLLNAIASSPLSLQAAINCVLEIFRSHKIIITVDHKVEPDEITIYEINLMISI